MTASLLIEQGYKVTGVFMKNWEEDDKDEYCAAEADLADARSVCEKLAIELRTINFSHEYWERVFTHFLRQYESGLTPNPDVLCNREIKFKEFLDYAQALGAELMATGHYAGITRDKGVARLLRGRDLNKDQSYFLYALNQNALNKTLFPLHKLSKPEVRDRARHLGLPVYDKKDSTGICFIGERRFKDFLGKYVKRSPGQVRDLEEQVIGVHDGLNFYTIGQRQGLGIGGAGDPWYVIRKDINDNLLYVAQGHDHPALLSTWLRSGELNWVSGQAPELPKTCTAKIRYRQGDQACTIVSAGKAMAEVRFANAQRAVTPGQAVVFYDGEVCMGGGTIVDCEALATTVV